MLKVIIRNDQTSNAENRRMWTENMADQGPRAVIRDQRFTTIYFYDTRDSYISKPVSPKVAPAKYG